MYNLDAILHSIKMASQSPVVLKPIIGLEKYLDVFNKEDRIVIQIVKSEFIRIPCCR